MSFFVGLPDGRHAGRDDLAQQIAEQGKQFAEEHWRWEDMQVRAGTRCEIDGRAWLTEKPACVPP